MILYIGACIAIYPSDVSPPSHRESPDATQVNLRAEMLAEILNAESALSEMVDSLRLSSADAAVISAGEQQLQTLGGLQRKLAEGGGSLQSLKAAVSSSVAVANSFIQQGRANGTNAREADLAALHAASTEAHRATDSFVHDFYEKRIFDPYLHFNNSDEERAYREREASRKQAIEDAQAENSPRGNLRAIELAEAQMQDAGAHGADHSPLFKDTNAQLESRRLALQGALARTTPEKSAQETPPTTSPRNSPADLPVDPQILAALKSSGVTLADQKHDGHGVTVDASILAALGRA